MLLNQQIPTVRNGKIIELAFQVTNKGFETDDLFIKVLSPKGEHKLLFQVKSNIALTQKSDLFEEVISAFWKDFNNKDLFDKTKDQLLLVKTGLNHKERNQIVMVLNWARSHATSEDFMSEVNRVSEKEKVYDVFKTVITKTNDNEVPSDENIWTFLKCFYLLGYNYLDSGSTDKNYIVNLIEACTNLLKGVTGQTVWNSIFNEVSILNKDGGSVTIESIKNTEAYNLLDVTKISNCSSSLEKLIRDSELVLKPIQNDIAGLILQRNELEIKIVETIGRCNFTVITGKPGVGKSAMMKSVINKYFADHKIVVFKADQLHEPQLANVLSKQGIDVPINDLVSSLSHQPFKLIVIDSLEKLLEGYSDNAFMQLLHLLRDNNDIKILTTARQYSLNLVYQKYGIDSSMIGSIRVEKLSASELETISNKVPSLASPISNVELKSIVCIPKYLEFIYQTYKRSEIDFSSVDLASLKRHLWDILVLNHQDRKDGLPKKREKAFIDIALKRARKMSLFVEPQQASYDVLLLLENDQIIYKDSDSNRYSPSHDILEDWALVRYIATKFYERETIPKFFEDIGTFPAIKRAFRLWARNNWFNYKSTFLEIINEPNIDISRFWIDEIYISILQSNNSHLYFDSQKEQLIQENSIRLNRVLHLLKTTCKQSYFHGDRRLLLPKGNSWSEAVIFIGENLDQIKLNKSVVLNFLSDWHWKVIRPVICDLNSEELSSVRIILSAYLEYYELSGNGNNIRPHEREVNQLLDLFLDMAKYNVEAVKELITKSINLKSNSDFSYSRNIYNQVIVKSRSFHGSRKLCSVAPMFMFEFLESLWFIDADVVRENKKDQFYRSTFRSTSEYWGLKSESAFSPSGYQKTPILNLLYSHPILAIKKTINILNRIVSYYDEQDISEKEELLNFEICLPDGTTIVKKGNYSLWIAYRGIGVIHPAIECILMAVEKFLFEINDLNYFREIIDYILINSNNISTTSVIVSVFMANPENATVNMLSIFSNIEFYHWDLSRSTSEYASLAPIDFDDGNAQRIRSESNMLPHRRKFRAGLRNFAFQYQINYGKLNTQLYVIFDHLKKKISDDNLNDKKLLIDIDLRNYKFGKYDSTLGGIPLEPKYDSEIEDISKENEVFIGESKLVAKHSSYVEKIYKKEEKIDLVKWREVFLEYSSKGDNLSSYAKPITLAYIGLSDLKGELTEEEQNWCINTIYNTFRFISLEEHLDTFAFHLPYNLLEKELCFNAIHLIAEGNNNFESDNFLSILCYSFYSQVGRLEFELIPKYFRLKFHSEQSKSFFIVWNVVLELSQSIDIYSSRYTSEEVNEVIKEQDRRIELFKTGISNYKSESERTDINFDSYNPTILTKLFCSIPYDTSNEVMICFRHDFLLLVFEEMNLENRFENRRFHYDFYENIQKYLVELILYASTNISEPIVEILISRIIEGKYYDPNSNEYEFVKFFLSKTRTRFDELTYNKGDDYDPSLKHNFWNCLNYIYLREKSAGTKRFTKSVLLGENWRIDVRHWNPLVKMEVLYNQMSLYYAELKPVLHVLSTIGAKVLLPNSISIVREICNKNKLEEISLNGSDANRLVKILFDDKILDIKNDKKLVDDYLWLLDTMIMLGSSEAYFYRELFISYKTNEN